MAINSANIRCPVTECSNELTVGLGSVRTEKDILRLLRGTDSQIFSGWHEHVGLLDEEIIFKIEKGASILAKVIKNREGRIIISGCGTSGRIACLTCVYVNRVLKNNGFKECCEYVCSGGDGSLVLSNEFHEDDPFVGANDLKEKLNGVSGEIVFIGVTCGLSAPYVAGQIDYLLHKKSCLRTNDNHDIDNINIILIGFNPVALARSTVIEKWETEASLTGSKCFLDVASILDKRAETDERCLVINPVIGPEPISGSSRMKGGSATKIILDSMFAEAFETSKNYIVSKDDMKDQISTVTESLLMFADASRRSYLELTKLSEVIKHASSSIKRTNEDESGHVYYVGKDVAGVIGVIDASEMPDTFGSSFTEFRGFIHGGWSDLGGNEAMWNLNELYHIKTKDFVNETVPHLTCKDLVIGLCINDNTDIHRNPNINQINSSKFLPDDELMDVLRICSKGSGKIAVIQVTSLSIEPHPEVFLGVKALDDKDDTDEMFRHIEIVTIKLPRLGILPGRTELAEMCLKWIVNAISSGAQIMNGKVLKNRMINFSPSNNKLFRRSVEMIQTLTGLHDSHLAKECLLKSIYHVNEVTQEKWLAPISDHVMAATPNEEKMFQENKVMPVALLLAAHLSKQSHIRNITGFQEHISIDQALKTLLDNPKILAKI